MKLTRQARLVRDHLHANAHLTSWQAEGVYRIRRLASRIHELSAHGYDIVKETCEDATRQRYTRYSFSRIQKRRRTPLHPAQKADTRILMSDLQSAYATYCRVELGMDREDEVSREVSDLMKFLEARQ